MLSGNADSDMLAPRRAGSRRFVAQSVARARTATTSTANRAATATIARSTPTAWRGDCELTPDLRILRPVPPASAAGKARAATRRDSNTTRVALQHRAGDAALEDGRPPSPAPLHASYPIRISPSPGDRRCTQNHHGGEHDSRDHLWLDSLLRCPDLRTGRLDTAGPAKGPTTGFDTSGICGHPATVRLPPSDGPAPRASS